MYFLQISGNYYIRRCDEQLKGWVTRERESDFSHVNFEVLEGHPIRDGQKAFGNAGMKPKDLEIHIWKTLAFIEKAQFNA